MEKLPSTNPSDIASIILHCRDVATQALVSDAFDAVVGEIGTQESSREGGIYDEIFTMAKNIFGAVSEELTPEAAAFVDGACVAIASADTLADELAVDKDRVRAHFVAHLAVQTSEQFAANQRLYASVTTISYGALQLAAEAEYATEPEQQACLAGHDVIATRLAHSVFSVRAQDKLADAWVSVSTGRLDEDYEKLFIEKEPIVVEPELIPDGYEQPFDPLGHADEALACSYMLGRLGSHDSINHGIRALYRLNMLNHPDLIERLLNIGKFLEPYDDDMDMTDPHIRRAATFSSGAALALGMVDILSIEARGKRRDLWREAWIDAPQMHDFPAELSREVETPHEAKQVGDALMDLGNIAYENMDDVYKQMIETIEDNYPGIVEHSNIFRASFAYVFQVGRQILAEVTLAEQLDEIVENAMPKEKYFEAEARLFLNGFL